MSARFCASGWVFATGSGCGGAVTNLSDVATTSTGALAACGVVRVSHPPPRTRPPPNSAVAVFFPHLRWTFCPPPAPLPSSSLFVVKVAS